MRTLTLASILTLSVISGCSTVKSGLSALGGGKPHQVTVVNNLPPAQVVVVQEPIVATEEPVAVARPAAKRSRLKAVASGAMAGALVGTAVGYAIAGSHGAAKGAALGAGAGAVGGAAASR